MPLLLFAAATWRLRVSTCAYLIAFSLCVDVYRVLTLVAYDDAHLEEQRKPLLLMSTLLAFLLKVTNL